MSSQRLTISLGALAENYRLCREHIAAQHSELGVVVKADAYGLGVARIAPHLYTQGARHFFVATFAEGQAVRSVLPQTDVQIFVLEGLCRPCIEFQRADLTPVLNTMDQCRQWHAMQRPLVIHVDTGMQRLGLTPKHLMQMIDELQPEIGLLMTHLACADEPGHTANQVQLNTFMDLHAAAETQLTDAIPVSIGNTAGLMAVTNSPQVARAGIGLYGGNPFVSQANPFLPVACLEGQVLQLREIQPGTAVGYGATYVAQTRQRLATVALGYADGVPRLLSNNGRVWCRGGYAPIVGRVSMDLISVDVTQLGDVCVGDWVELFGSHVSIDDVAAQTQTISYEILTGVSRRPVRVYQQNLLGD